MINKCFIALVALASCVFAYETEVVELTDNDFADRIGEVETTLVMFYAPWCGHCKRLKPDYEKAADELGRDVPPIRLAKVDCTEGGKETCNKFSVSGYPTLKIFRNGGSAAEYSGPRHTEGIIKYMRKQVGPASREIKSVKEFLDAVADSKEVTIFGFFEKDSDLKSVFLKYADKMRENFRFAHTSASDVLEKQGEKDAIILLRPTYLKNKFEEDQVKFEGKTIEELTEFVTKNTHGLCGHRTRENIQDFNKPFIVAYYDIDYVKNPKGTNYYRNRVLKVAKEFEGRITFAISSQDDFQHEVNEYGIDMVVKKPLILARDAKGRKYIMKDEFSIENLRTFATNFEQGTLEPFIKSEEIPESNDAPVKVAVAKNFDEIVINNDKDVLIEFYAPWCGHCKKLVPIYEEVATTLQGEDVVLVKMDATANDVPPEFEVRGFPTLYWLPKDSKNTPVAYDAGREPNDFIKFIAKRATNELKGWDRSGNPKESKKTEL